MKNQNHIVILVGVCGTGKNAVGQKVANNLDVPFIDADKLPISNELPKGKISPDVDIEKWLLAIKALLSKHSTEKGCVISCSLLKKEDRMALSAHANQELDWIFMRGSYEDVAKRAELIGDHNRPVSLLKSDFEALEVPKRALTIDITNSEQEIIDTILKYLARKYG